MAASSVLKDDEEYLTMERSVISLTFGECVENHAGMQKIGVTAKAGEGLTVGDCSAIKRKFISEYSHVPEIEKRVKLFNLKSILEARIQSGKESKKIPEGAIVPDAAVLIIKGGVDLIFGAGFADKLFQEQTKLETDKQMYAYGGVRNKHARHNLCFAGFGQRAHFSIGKGTIISFDDSVIPFLKMVRDKLGSIHPKLEGLLAEGNYYYDVDKCYISYHVDQERRKVLCVRLGADFPILYQWYHGASGGVPFGEKIETVLSHGDIYIMSEEAVGTDSLSKRIEYRNRFTLRHAAGFEHVLAAKSKPKKKKTPKEKEGYVLNPKTGKMVKIGGPTYKKMIKEN